MTCDIQYHSNLPKGGAQDGVYRSVITFCAGRDGNDDFKNEDIAIVEQTPYGTILAVVDGATARTPHLISHPSAKVPVTSGYIAGRIEERHIRALAPGISFEDLVQGILDEALAVQKRPDFPEREILAASCTIYVPWAGEHGELWSLGDCMWGYRQGNATGPWTDSQQNQPPVSSTHALHRTAAITAAMKQRGLAIEAVQRSPQLMGELAALGRKAMDDLRLADAGETWMSNRGRVKARMAPPVALPGDLHLLMLATDGFLTVPKAVDLGLASLAYLRREDPLMLGTNGLGLATAKGFVDNNGTVHPYTDDVGIVAALF